MVSLDDASATQLSPLLEDVGFDYDRCAETEAVSKFDERRTDLLITTFSDGGAAQSLIEHLRHSSLSKTAVTLVLVSDPGQVTHAFGAGANFVLMQPLQSDNTGATLRAAAALLQRERRRQFRVPVQLPVALSYDSNPNLEGILLDLSEGGMDVLAAQPLSPGQAVQVSFCLPHSTDMQVGAQVVWANPNGQSGLQFVSLSEEQSRGLSAWLGSNAPQLPPEDPEPLADNKLSDLSLGACYVETLAPFPRATRVDVCLRVGEFEIHLDGIVRVVYPGHGIGIEFTRTENHKKLVLSLIERLSGEPGAIPDVLLWPKGFNFKSALPDAVEPDELDDALLQLLCSRTVLAQDEFLAELRQQRSSASQEVAPA
jgi:Tfp pilus assembly protein PilZ